MKGTLQPRAVRSVTRVLLLTLACAISGCDAPTVPPRVHTAALDPEVMALGDRTLIQNFDGELSAIKLGHGWLGPEPKENPEQAWAAKRAILYFPTPVGGAIDFVAYCTRFAYPNAPLQNVQPILNGHWQPAIELAAGWGELRILLPSDQLDPRLNTLELLFDYAERPNEVTSSDANRPVSTLFKSVALVPRSAPRDNSGVHADFDPTTQRLTLHAGGRAVTLPVPAAASFKVRLGAVESTGRGSLVLRLISAGGEPLEVWRGNAVGAANLTLTVPHPAATNAQLAIQLLAPEPAPISTLDEPTTVTLTLGPDVIVPQQRSGAQPSQRPHIFIYLIDTLRADALGIYGAERPTSPEIDRFAADAVVFDHAWSASAWTLPATASVLTGVYPSRHGRTRGSVRGQGDNPPPTLAERLGGAGYDTLAVSQTYIAGSAYGLDRGFETFYLNDVLGHWTRDSGNIRWFLWRHLLGRTAEDPPLFAYAHTVAPHAPYIPRGDDARFAAQSPGALSPRQYQPHMFMEHGFGTDRKETARLRALYDGEILYADRQFGAFIELLKYLDLYDNSMIVLLSDHGEEFFEHGGFDHSRTLFQELLHVPLVVKLPGGQHAGTRIAQRVSTLDIVPTILDLVADSTPGTETLDGVSLLNTLTSDAPAQRRVIFAEVNVDAARDRYAAVDQTAIVAGNLKCIHSKLEVNRFFQPVPSYRVYDLAADPGELNPLPLSEAKAARCVEALKQWTDKAADRTLGASSPEPLSDAEKARLEALGYL